jgi:uncharacterized DUF497 family protein
MKRINWNAVKNQLLMDERGISFEDIVFALQNGDLLDDMKHPSKSNYPSQRLLVVRVDNYAYLVPYIESNGELFLKTIIPSRKATKKYLRGES